MKRAAAACQACPLYERGTRTVFGEGMRRARVVLVGEQPGDREDRTGRPFVGPAGHLLDQALVRAQIPRQHTYVTNVVKHFKCVQKGQRRLHQTPNAREIGACLPWLEAELELIRPLVVVCLGVTAAKVLIGRDFRASTGRGKFVENARARFVTATVHPSAVLRARTDEARQQGLMQLVADLANVARVLGAHRQTGV